MPVAAPDRRGFANYVPADFRPAPARSHTGGLLLWDKMPPLDWRFDDYNSDARVADVMDFLADAEVVRVPYRCNRAVVFDSELLHKTDHTDFRAGYQNRRINITMLFGERQRRSGHDIDSIQEKIWRAREDSNSQPPDP